MLTINGDANQDTFGSGEQKHNIQRHVEYNLNQEFIHFLDIPLDLEEFNVRFQNNLKYVS